MPVPVKIQRLSQKAHSNEWITDWASVSSYIHHCIALTLEYRGDERFNLEEMLAAGHQIQSNVSGDPPTHLDNVDQIIIPMVSG